MSKLTPRRQFLVMFSSGTVASILAIGTQARPLRCENTAAIGQKHNVKLADARWAVKRLEVEFYHGAIFGASLATRATGRAARKVAFSDPILRRHVREIAADKAEHLALMSPSPRSGNLIVDLSPRPFVRVARAAGLSPSESFDPYADEHSFLLAAHMLESAVAPLHDHTGQGETDVGALARLRADAGYHAGLIRAAIQTRESSNPLLGAAADRITAVFARVAHTREPDAGGEWAALDGVLLGADGRGRGGFFPLGLPGVRQVGA